MKGVLPAVLPAEPRPHRVQLWGSAAGELGHAHRPLKDGELIEIGDVGIEVGQRLPLLGLREPAHPARPPRRRQRHRRDGRLEQRRLPVEK